MIAVDAEDTVCPGFAVDDGEVLLQRLIRLQAVWVRGIQSAEVDVKVSAISLDSSWDDSVPRDRIDIAMLRGVVQVPLIEWYCPTSINVQWLRRVVVGVSIDDADEGWCFIRVRLTNLESALVGSCDQVVDD